MYLIYVIHQVVSDILQEDPKRCVNLQYPYYKQSLHNIHCRHFKQLFVVSGSNTLCIQWLVSVLITYVLYYYLFVSRLSVIN